MVILILYNCKIKCKKDNNWLPYYTEAVQLSSVHKSAIQCAYILFLHKNKY